MRWLDVKYGTKEDRRQWLKLVGVKTNIVTSVEVSDGYAHDYPFYKGLSGPHGCALLRITVELSSILYVLAFRSWMEDVLFILRRGYGAGFKLL